MTLTRHETIGDLEWPEHAIVVADASLPESLLADLDDFIGVEAGESLKTIVSIERLAERILERRASRPMTLVAVGGGSVGDAVGFLASILWRGVELWHVPTTLLAMVDSAHGGKTAVNLGRAKNQLGTFYPADRVALVEACLETLPMPQRRDGLVELVKALWIGAPEAFTRLEAKGGIEALASAPFDAVRDRLMALLERAIDVKREVVERDPRETKGIRTFLNLGHTVAHALELEVGISHGQAVGWGLLACAGLSESTIASFSSDEARRLRRHLHPLLAPDGAVSRFDDGEAFRAALSRDKKHVDGQLRSVRLRNAGQPEVTTEPTPDDWMCHLQRAIDWFRTTSVSATRVASRSASLSLESSKSEMNRALVIRHLRSSPTAIEGASRADDVQMLQTSLERLAHADREAVEVECGQGGTTLRFLLAVAATRSATTTLRADSTLMHRPHAPLIDALEASGAEIERIDGDIRGGYRVRGWHDWPKVLAVDVSKSSQFASALALLSATGRPLVLDIQTEGTSSGIESMPSRPYFDMTLDFLRQAGVSVEREGHRLALRPKDDFGRPRELHPNTDASSAAVWAVARHLGCEATIANPPRADRQPDTGIEEMLSRLSRSSEPDDDCAAPVVFDLNHAPDLVPILAVASTQSPAEVHLRGATHLKYKESNRIEDLVEAMRSVGLAVEGTNEGVVVPAGCQSPEAHSRWPTHEDHRLAMAGLLASAIGPTLIVERPHVVTKSYPDFWQHARRVGWSISPEDDKTSDASSPPE